VFQSLTTSKPVWFQPKTSSLHMSWRWHNSSVNCARAAMFNLRLVGHMRPGWGFCAAQFRFMR